MTPFVFSVFFLTSLTLSDQTTNNKKQMAKKTAAPVIETAEVTTDGRKNRPSNYVSFTPSELASKFGEVKIPIQRKFLLSHLQSRFLAENGL